MYRKATARVLHPSCKYSLSAKFFKKSLFLTLYFLPFDCNSTTKNLNFVSNFGLKLWFKKKYAYIDASRIDLIFDNYNYMCTLT